MLVSDRESGKWFSAKFCIISSAQRDKRETTADKRNQNTDTIHTANGVCFDGELRRTARLADHMAPSGFAESRAGNALGNYKSGILSGKGVSTRESLRESHLERVSRVSWKIVSNRNEWSGRVDQLRWNITDTNNIWITRWTII